MLCLFFDALRDASSVFSCYYVTINYRLIGETKMTIRTAELKDFHLIKQYDKHIAEIEFTNVITLGRIIMIEEEGKLIGWLRYNYFWDNIPFINMLYVLEEYRGKGYGKKLLENWEQKMKQLGFHIVLTSTQSNEYSQHFYAQFGYTAMGGFSLGNAPYEIIMSKEL